MGEYRVFSRGFGDNPTVKIEFGKNNNLKTVLEETRESIGNVPYEVEAGAIKTLSHGDTISQEDYNAIFDSFVLGDYGSIGEASGFVVEGFSQNAELYSLKLYDSSFGFHDYVEDNNLSMSSQAQLKYSYNYRTDVTDFREYFDIYLCDDVGNVLASINGSTKELLINSGGSYDFLQYSFCKKSYSNTNLQDQLYIETTAGEIQELNLAPNIPRGSIKGLLEFMVPQPYVITTTPPDGSDLGTPITEFDPSLTVSFNYDDRGAPVYTPLITNGVLEPDITVIYLYEEYGSVNRLTAMFGIFGPTGEPVETLLGISWDYLEEIGMFMGADYDLYDISFEYTNTTSTPIKEVVEDLREHQSKYALLDILAVNESFLMTEVADCTWLHVKMINGTHTSSTLIEREFFEDTEDITLLITVSPELTGTLTNSGGTVTFTSSDPATVCRINRMYLRDMNPTPDPPAQT